jgi:hypothetical protein
MKKIKIVGTSKITAMETVCQLNSTQLMYAKFILNSLTTKVKFNDDDDDDDDDDYDDDDVDDDNNIGQQKPRVYASRMHEFRLKLLLSY